MAKEKTLSDMTLEDITGGLRLSTSKNHIFKAYEIIASLDIDKDSPVADFGCFGQETLTILRKMGFTSITVADYDDKILEGVRNEYGKEVPAFQADFNGPLPFDDDSFDMVTTFEVIEHLVNAEVYMREVFRVLKPGGKMIITTPNHAFFKSRMRALKGRRLGMEGDHYRFFTKDHFEEVIEQAGFKITKRNSIGHLPLGDSKAVRTVLNRKQVRHFVPEAIEALCAINFVWLCEKKD